LYRIGELAELAGVNKSVVDHYTRLGLIEPEKRSDGKYRLYSEEALKRIDFVKKCQEKRLSLAEIREALEGERSIGKAEVSLCMANASIALDEALGELKGISASLENASSSDLDAVKKKASMLMIKVVAMSELLQIMSQQL